MLRRAAGELSAKPTEGAFSIGGRESRIAKLGDSAS
jgi:hypothetical protein